MKITNLSGSSLFLSDLWAIRESQNQGRRGEAQYIAPGASLYLPNTSEVMRSAYVGHIAKWRDAGVLELEDTDTLEGGASVTYTHNFGFPPGLYVLKNVVGVGWVDATGTFDAVHSFDFMNTTITNTTGGPLTYLTRLL